MEKPKNRPETDAQKIDEFVRRQAIAAADDYERRLNADASLDHIRLTPEMKEDMMRRIAELEGRAGAGTGADTESADAGRFADTASVGAGGFTGAADTGESAGAESADAGRSADTASVGAGEFTGVVDTSESAGAESADAGRFADTASVGAGGFTGAAGTGESVGAESADANRFASAMDVPTVGAGDAASEHAATAEDALRLLSEEDRRALEVGRETLAKRGRRRRWRVVGIAAAAVVVVLGIGMTSTANRLWLANLWKSLLGEEAWFQFNNDDVENTNNWSIQDACADILEQTGIRAVQFMYMPEGMLFESYAIDADITSAYMRYTYQETVFNVRMIKKRKNAAIGITFEGEIQDTFVIDTIYGEITVQEIKEPQEEFAYGTELLYDNCQYIIMGVMEKEEFIKIIENINLF